MKAHLLAATGILTLIAAGPVSAQTATGKTMTNGQNAASDRSVAGAAVVPIAKWDGSAMRDGYSAEALIDTDVYSANGDEIGEVQNIVVGPNGQIRSLIVEVGGFLDIGDTHFSVPWKQATISPDVERVTVPITDKNYRDYSLFGGFGEDYRGTDAGVRKVDDDADARGRAWKVSELLDDNVRLSDVRGYGYVDDLIFDKGGKLQAVVTQTDVGFGGHGPYAYPFYGYANGFDPGADYYQLPYGRNDVANLNRFDYNSYGVLYPDYDGITNRVAGSSGSAATPNGTSR
nr:PRC-barrel domain-containing protein [uncultured Azospirillum sp.]